MLDLGAEGRILADARLVVVIPPCPGVAKPQMREDVQLGGFWTTVVASDSEEQLVRVVGLLCSLDEAVPVFIVLEDAGVHEIVLSFLSGPPGILFDDVFVGERFLGQLVQELHVRVRGRVVEMEVCFFDRLAVHTLGVRETEQTFLEMTTTICYVHAAMGVRNTSNAVFAPSKGSAAGHVVGEVCPGIAVGSVREEVSRKDRRRVCGSNEEASSRVVLTDDRPLAFGNIWSPLLPVFGTFLVFSQTGLLGTEHILLVDDDHDCGASDLRPDEISEVSRGVGLDSNGRAGWLNGRSSAIRSRMRRMHRGTGSHRDRGVCLGRYGMQNDEPFRSQREKGSRSRILLLSTSMGALWILVGNDAEEETMLGYGESGGEEDGEEEERSEEKKMLPVWFFRYLTQLPRAAVLVTQLFFSSVTVNNTRHGRTMEDDHARQICGEEQMENHEHVVNFNVLLNHCDNSGLAEIQYARFTSINVMHQYISSYYLSTSSPYAPSTGLIFFSAQPLILVKYLCCYSRPPKVTTIVLRNLAVDDAMRSSG
nr:hypothetical protein CFP56_78097 [Quercus suber]